MKSLVLIVAILALAASAKADLPGVVFDPSSWVEWLAGGRARGLEKWEKPDFCGWVAIQGSV